MKASIIEIGNSKGIRLPKVLLRECHIEDEVEIEREGDTLIISPVKRKPRAGWNEAFMKMRELQEDELILDEGVEELEVFEWK